MWDKNHLCIKMNGEVYNQLSLSVNMHLHETKHLIPIRSKFSLYALQWLGTSRQSNNITISQWFFPLNHGHELVIIRLNG